MSLLLRTTPEADIQIRHIDEWWREHRAGAADVFTNELTSSFHLIAAAPHIGRRYTQSPILDIRRYLLRESRHHVYYVVEGQHVHVLAVWHARRGEQPPLHR